MLKPTGTQIPALSVLSERGKSGLNENVSGRTSEELRDTLWDEIESVRTVKTSVQQANAIANLAKTILQSVQMELDYQKLITDRAGKPPILGAVRLARK